MARHSGSVEIDRAISTEEAVEMLRQVAPPKTEGPLTRAVPAEAPVSAAAPPEAAQTAPAKHRLRRLLLATAGLAALGAGAYFAWDYWTVGRFHVSTDDAYVQADNITIAPKVSGYLAEVLVADNETVKGGQIWRGSTIATIRLLSIRPGPMSRPHRRPSPASERRSTRSNL